MTDYAWKTCVEKIPYRSKAKARRKAIWLNSRYPAGENVRWYKCVCGNHWHLTSEPDRFTSQPADDQPTNNQPTEVTT